MLREVEPDVRPVTLRRVASRLQEALARTEALAARLAAARLADRRLEDQRARAADALASVVAAMESVARAARDGDPEAAETGAAAFLRAVGRLRSLSASG